MVAYQSVSDGHRSCYILWSYCIGLLAKARDKIEGNVQTEEITIID